MSANAPERIELFSAYAEVFLEGAGSLTELCRFSLPTQRCFLLSSPSYPASTLFSAYAEVFPGR